MKTLFLLLVLVAASLAQILLPIGGGGQAVAETPTIATTCWSVGTAGPLTTPAIDTTGAKVIIFSFSGLAGQTFTVSDNKSNGDATALTGRAASTGGGWIQQFYWLSPTVGTGHTFTIPNTGNIYVGACVTTIGGITGVYDSQQAESAGTTTCSAGSITPSSGPHVIVASLSTGTGSVLETIDSGYTIGAQEHYVTGVSFGVAAAYLVQTNGAATNPEWTTIGDSVCGISSFH